MATPPQDPFLTKRGQSTVYTRTLVRAVEIAGGVEELGAFLASTPAEIATWSTGVSNPPMPIFLALVDVVAANALTPTALENLPIARRRRSAVLPDQ